MIKWILNILWWITGQRKMRILHAEFLEKVRKEATPREMLREVDRLKRIERFEYEATISTKVSVWVSRCFDQQTSPEETDPEITKILQQLSRLKALAPPPEPELPPMPEIKKPQSTEAKGMSRTERSMV